MGSADHYNPNTPQALGVEWPPLVSGIVPYGSTVELGHTFESKAAQTVTEFDWYGASLLSTPFRFHMLGTVYERGNEQITDIRRTMVAVNGGSGGTLGGGASSITQALSDPGDDKHVVNDTPIYLDFATAGKFTGRRVLKVILHYSWLNSTLADTELFPTVGMIEPTPGATAVWGVMKGDQLHAGEPPARAVRQVSLGEIWPSGSPIYNGDQTASAARLPWLVSNLEGLDTGEFRFLLASDSAATAQWHYVALEVVHCEENRVAFAGATYVDTYLAAGWASKLPEVGWNSIGFPGTPAGGTSWAKANGVDYTLVWTVGDTGGPWIGSASSSTHKTVGAAPTAPTLDSLVSALSTHKGRAMPRNADNAVVTVPVDLSRLVPGQTLTADPDYRDSHTYSGAAGAYVSTGRNAAQTIAQRSGGGTVSYPFIRFWARQKAEGTADLVVTSSTSVATLTAAAFAALPEIVDGWREVLLTFGIARAVDNSGTAITVTFTSAAAAGEPWEVLMADEDLNQFGSAFGGGTYEGGTLGLASYVIPDSGAGFAADATADLVVHLLTAVPAVAGFTATAASQALTGLSDGCATAGNPESLGFVGLAWTATTVAQLPADRFAFYEVQRRDDCDDCWSTILLTSEQAVTGFADFEARVGVTSYYRIRACSTTGVCSDWSVYDTHLRTTGVNGSTASTPDAAALDITGDIDIRVDVSLDDWTPATDEGLVGKWVSAGNQRSYALRVLTSGVLQLLTSPDGIATVTMSPTVGLGIPDGGRRIVRATLDVNDGAGNRVARFYSSTDGETWDLIQTITTAGTTSIFNSTSPLVVGSIGAVEDPTTGRVYRAQVRNGIEGTVVANPDFTSQTAGAGSFVDSAGRAWTVNSPASIVAGTQILIEGPGVTMTSGEDCGVLLFTSNAAPTRNAAYVQPFDAAVSEEFGFVEAGQVTFQQLHNRDYQLAVRPLERGGVTFTRAVLVNAICVPRDCDVMDRGFRQLRDLAWDSLPYVAVRDELGNRWYSNVRVPSGTIRRQAQLYIAQVEVTEVSGTPAAVSVPDGGATVDGFPQGALPDPVLAVNAVECDVVVSAGVFA